MIFVLVLDGGRETSIQEGLHAKLGVGNLGNNPSITAGGRRDPFLPYMLQPATTAPTDPPCSSTPNLKMYLINREVVKQVLTK